MTRGVWAAVAVCAVGVGCTGPQYYTPPQEQVPLMVDAGGVPVNFSDQRPEWEKKPFTGEVSLYHLGKAHPGAWEQLSQEAAAVVAEMPQKPARVDVAVTSFRLVRAVGSSKRFHDWNAGPHANPGARALQRLRADGEEREQRLAQINGTSGDNAEVAPANKVEVALSSKDDPRRLLQDHPTGASCAIQATVRLVFPDGREQSADIKTIARGANDSGTAYWGEAMDFAAKTAVHDFGRQFRSAVGLNPDS